MQTVSLYIHWPFCLSKCPYCDFNSHVRARIPDADYEKALLVELEYFARLLQGQNRKLKSIFFGGGTPSLMHPKTVQKLIDRAIGLFNADQALEVTLEGNPTSIEQQKYQEFKTAGVNRVSIGIQSLHARHLQFLGRNHSAKEALDALEMATQLFQRVNFDLIYALPDQSLREWERDLATIVGLGTKHLSLYQLTIEEGTPFHNRFHRGEFQLPSESLAADFFEITNAFLSTNDLSAYELSNHAAPGHECQHNLCYWRYEDYIGIGPGAHGRITLDQSRRIGTEMIRAPEAWLKAVEQNKNGLRSQEQLSTKDQLLEHLLMNFRIKDGINKRDFQERHGACIESVLDDRYFKSLQDQGFISDSPESIKLTGAGMLAMDRVLRDLIKDNLDDLFD